MKQVISRRGSPSKTGQIYLRAMVVLLLFVSGIALAALAVAPPKSARPDIAAAMTPSVLGAAKLPQTLPTDMPVTLTIVLNRADQTGFEKSLQAMQDPKSPSYRHYLLPHEQAERYGPSASSYDAVNDWLHQQGFNLVEGSENRLTLTVSGTRAQAEKAFGVSIESYRMGDREFYSNDRDPQLPAGLSHQVQAVIGLS